jgi:hypothetical protein
MRDAKPCSVLPGNVLVNLPSNPILLPSMKIHNKLLSTATYYTNFAQAAVGNVLSYYSAQLAKKKKIKASHILNRSWRDERC